MTLNALRINVRDNQWHGLVGGELNFVARGQERVEPLNQVAVARKQIRHALDDARRVDAAVWAHKANAGDGCGPRGRSTVGVRVSDRGAGPLLALGGTLAYLCDLKSFMMSRNWL